VLATGTVAYLWVSYGQMIDARLGGERQPLPRIYGRGLELAAGTPMPRAEFVQRLRELGYIERAPAHRPGQCASSGSAIVFVTRPEDVDVKPRRIEVSWASARASAIGRLVVDGQPAEHVMMDPPLVAALSPGEKRRYVPLSSIPAAVVQAVLAIEDRRFYDHPGVDPIRAVGALVTNLRGDRPYLVGASTLTQQIVKNTFLTPAKTLRRKVQEQLMALVLETRLTKDQILELYLNEVVLGQYGPFEIHGVAEGSRIFFGKQLGNTTLAEAATMAGLIQSPSRLSPFRSPDAARSRRNVVLGAMVDAGYLDAADAERAAAEPLAVSARALENEAPYFVDYVSQQTRETRSGWIEEPAAVDVYTTLDLHLQRIGQEAVSAGVADIDRQLAARGRSGRVQAALVAVDPRSGDILALVGGRAYQESQYNRATLARRQPGSIFKPFVYLAAFEAAATGTGAGLTPASVVLDEPTVFRDGSEDYVPANYQSEYDGAITIRQALARSRNVVAIKVAEVTGYERVADLWSRVGVGTTARPVPSIALGVFEATPLEMAEAYTLFVNDGTVRPLRAVRRLVGNGRTLDVAPTPGRRVARADTTYLVTSLLESVLNEGTGRGTRARGFTRDAAGKTGTTNDLRDAWFVGFTPELLAVVWVGFDDNEPVGLGGAQAALPIWTAFMKDALAGHPNRSFQAPSGVTTALIDRQTGMLARPECPDVVTEVFLAGTEPETYCDLHGGGGVGGFFSGVGRAIRSIFH